jgi:hypothetical protein
MMPGNQKIKNYPWGHERRFNAYSNYFREIYGARVQKMPALPVRTAMDQEVLVVVLIVIMTLLTLHIVSLLNLFLNRSGRE